MKKIEAIIKRSTYPVIISELSSMGYSIIDRRNLEDSKIFDKQLGAKIGSTNVKTIPLSKIELVVLEKDARLDISEHAEQAYADEEFKLDMDTYVDNLEEKTNFSLIKNNSE